MTNFLDAKISGLLSSIANAIKHAHILEEADMAQTLRANFLEIAQPHIPHTRIFRAAGSSEDPELFKSILEPWLPAWKALHDDGLLGVSATIKEASPAVLKTLLENGFVSQAHYWKILQRAVDESNPALWPLLQDPPQNSAPTGQGLVHAICTCRQAEAQPFAEWLQMVAKRSDIDWSQVIKNSEHPPSLWKVLCVLSVSGIYQTPDSEVQDLLQMLKGNSLPEILALPTFGSIFTATHLKKDTVHEHTPTPRAHTGCDFPRGDHPAVQPLAAGAFPTPDHI